ncbi:fimbria/pilus periplasmic chaperone [Cedecea davisae]|uniref:fimbria/pilus periplasmic chaperone n=1 Tax=Cedecea davisae TaxID=158484 RepID=UPI00376F1350
MVNVKRISAKFTAIQVTTVTLMLSTLLASQGAGAAISLDRTRVILDGEARSVTLTVTNKNKALPYLAQTWVEDEQGNKIQKPLLALPPLQRVEPGAKGQIKVQVASDMEQLPQDKESVFYFNVREIPPKSTKANSLQIALQTRVKLFYRPAAIHLDQNSKPWEQITLTRQGDKYVVHNPTPYFVTLTAVSPSATGNQVAGFIPVMLSPKADVTLTGSAKAMGNSPVLTYINDYGGHPRLAFGCAGSVCSVKSSLAG